MMNPLQDRPFYYLENFETVLAWIRTRHDDLLSGEEHEFIDGFDGLPRASKALLVRMLMRKGELFRERKLNYPEIGDIRQAAEPLIARRWVDSNPVIDIQQVFGLLTRPEIAHLFQLCNPLKAARKSQQLEALGAAHSEARPLDHWHPNSNEAIFRICVTALCDRLRLIFFGNLHQDWTEFVLADLGVFKYERVELLPASRGFQSRRDVDDYLRLHHCREQLRLGESADAILSALPTSAFSNPWLDAKREKLLFRLAQHHESLQQWPRALEIYSGCKFPGARIRAIRILERGDYLDAAWHLAGMAQSHPESEAEIQQLSRIIPRLLRKLGMPARGKGRTAPAFEAARIDLSLPIDGALTHSVEELARQHLQQRESAPVYYVENTLINSLFGLLCWNAIFAAIPGAFFHPFQSGPADLHDPAFLSRRSSQFAECIDLLDSESYKTSIRQNFRDKAGILSPFVSWEILSGELLDLALHCIPAAHLKVCIERILQDIRSNRSGLPDLIQFWPHQQRYRMIEVKGPGDRLQDNQIRWIDFCANHAIPVAVCYLRWAEESS